MISSTTSMHQINKSTIPSTLHLLNCCVTFCSNPQPHPLKLHTDLEDHVCLLTTHVGTILRPPTKFESALFITQRLVRTCTLDLDPSALTQRQPHYSFAHQDPLSRLRAANNTTDVVRLHTLVAVFLTGKQGRSGHLVAPGASCGTHS
jgi:hypothetical protein